MTISLILENIGPFDEAEIPIKPLTVFVGPNQIGKSYLMKLIYALHLCFDHDYYPSHMILQNEDIYYGQIQQFHNNPDGEALKDSIFKKFKNSLAIQIENNINLAFNINSVSKIKRANRRKCSIQLKTKYGKIKITIKRPIKIDIELLDKNRNSFNFVVDTDGEQNENSINLYGDNLKKYLKIVDKNISKFNKPTQIKNLVTPNPLSFITRLILREKIPLNSRYIPAGRPGFLMTESSVDKYIFDTTSRNTIPLLDHISTRFYSIMRFGSGEPNKFSELSDIIQRELLKGKLEYNKEKRIWLFYPKTGKSLKTTQVSSLILDLGSLDVILNSLVKNNTLLCYEEPESHLHLQYQILVIQILTNLANSGIQTIISTHSDTIIEVLSYLIQASSKKNKSALNALLPKSVINPKDVYLGILEEFENKTILRRSHVTNEGIDEEGFEDIWHNLQDLGHQVFE